ncbi:MAG: hypothetical protein IJG80_06095 [Selenomonadaceae bacterium]|nr:hypothetical protein [Selenomonadaceae bacterium]MBQ3726686.1 hypothetical protein [Selenomonadaceae bacterium]MBQ9497811.1 hypothetical protein [Selenomonadaceae bacterium]
MIWKILDRVFNERVSRVIAAIFLLSFAHMIIFGKGFDGMTTLQAYVFGLATPAALYNLTSGLRDEQPRRKVSPRRGAS